MVDWGGDMYQQERFADFVREASKERLASSALRSRSVHSHPSISALDAVWECWRHIEFRRAEQRLTRTRALLFQ